MHDGEEGELAAIGDRFPFLFNRQPGISISKLIYPTSSVKILLTKIRIAYMSLLSQNQRGFSSAARGTRFLLSFFECNSPDYIYV